MPVVQLAEGSRGARRGGIGLTVPDELVRPACEVAWAVARSLEVDEVPRPVRRFLKMQRLPHAALGPIRRVLDTDDAFRARAVEVADEAVVGRASWLFLARPEGWEEQLSSLVSAASEESTVAGLRRDVERLEAHNAELERRLEEALARVADAEQRLSAERARRTKADAAVAELEPRVDALRHERDDARARVRHAEARLAETEAHLAETVAAPPPSSSPPPAPESFVDATAAGAAIETAASALADLRDALDDAARALTPRPPPAADAAPEASPSSSASSPTSSTPRRRRPLTLPVGMFDDAVDAADWLVRVPGVVLLVDGYNCTLRDPSAGGLAIPDQRRRLVGALTSLATRTAADVEVVFDGADTGDSAPLAGPRSPVRVIFSDPEVEADDVLIARAGTIPPDRPVVVASSDRRVSDGARAAGANVITAEQLMALVRTRR